jgi:hypothetical protein
MTGKADALGICIRLRLLCRHDAQNHFQSWFRRLWARNQLMMSVDADLPQGFPCAAPSKWYTRITALPRVSAVGAIAVTTASPPAFATKL